LTGEFRFILQRLTLKITIYNYLKILGEKDSFSG
jgi:hypothetical protein